MNEEDQSGERQGNGCNHSGLDDCVYGGVHIGKTIKEKEKA